MGHIGSHMDISSGWRGDQAKLPSEVTAMLMGRGFRNSDPATGTSSNKDAVRGTGGILTDLSPSSRPSAQDDKQTRSVFPVLSGIPGIIVVEAPPSSLLVPGCSRALARAMGLGRCNASGRRRRVSPKPEQIAPLTPLLTRVSGRPHREVVTGSFVVTSNDADSTPIRTKCTQAPLLSVPLRA